MKSSIGYCKYCSASRMIMDSPAMTEEDRNNQASFECDCEGATAEREVQYLISTGEASLDLIVGKKSKKVAEVLRPFLELIARGRIKKISVNFDGITTASMYATSSGKKIAVETRETRIEYADGETKDMLPPE